jgi:hypothetical protein
MAHITVEVAARPEKASRSAAARARRTGKAVAKPADAS